MYLPPKTLQSQSTLFLHIRNPQIMADPLSIPPWLAVDGILNFRDIGGYPIQGSGGSVKKNLFYRSAEPSLVTPTGIQRLSELGITTFYDLRSTPELNKIKATMPVIEIPGVERRHVPVLEDKDYSPEALAFRFKEYSSGNLASVYRSILIAGSKYAYPEIFTHILTRPSEPFLIHCTAGKDRTGVLCALLLSLAGVADDVVAEEYRLTEVGLGWMRERIIKQLMSEPLFVAGDEEAKRGMENMLSSSARTMLDFLQLIRSEYGSPEGYIQNQCGFTKEQVLEIKNNLISDAPPSL